MKKMIGGVGLAVLLVASGITAAENLITEGEKQNWDGAASLDGKWAANPEKPGQAMLCLDSNVSGTPYWMRSLPQIEKARNYTLRIAVKAPAGTGYRAYVESNGKDACETFGAEWSQGCGKWETCSYDFCFKQMPVSPYVVLQLKGPGKVEFSELSIAEDKTDGMSLIRESRKKQWEFRNPENGSGDWVDSTDSADGKALHLKCEKESMLWIYPNVPLEFGRAYELRLQVKAGAEYRCYLENNLDNKFDGAGIFDWQPATQEWKTHSVEIKFSKVNAPPYLVLAINGKGEAWYRNLTIRPLPEKK